MVAMLAMEKNIELRTTFEYLGVQLQRSIYPLGVNKMVLDSCINLKSKLYKRHVLISYHYVRKAIAGKVIKFIHILRSIIPTDIFSKTWGYDYN